MVNMNTTAGRFWDAFCGYIIAIVIAAVVFGLAWKITVTQKERREKALVEAATFVSGSMAQCRLLGTARTDNECVNEAITATRNLQGNSFAGAVSVVLASRS